MQSLMATLTLKDLPIDLHRKLKARAEQNGRSLNREVIECLEASFRAERIDVDARIEEARAIRQSLTHRLGRSGDHASQAAGAPVIVVDTNVIAGTFLGRETPCVGEHVLARDPEWAVPLLWRSEFRNVLAGEMRRGRMSLDKAARIAGRAEAWVREREFSVPSETILALVARTRCTAYDCEFVALAQYLAVPLVTGDRQILAAFPETAVSPEAFSAH